MSRLSLFFKMLVVTLLLPTSLLSCRDDLDLDSAQAYLIKDKSKKNSPSFNPKRDTAQAPAVFRVKFRIENGGNFVIEVHRDWAPNSADRFYNLCRANYWKGNPLYRVLPEHLVQWGLHPNWKVTASWRTNKFQLDRAKKSNRGGYVCFAPDLDVGKPSTQILVNLSDHPEFDKQHYAPFGKVVQGIDAFARIYGGYGDLFESGNTEGPSSKTAAVQGMRYFARSFPRLDRIRSTSILKD